AETTCFKDLRTLVDRTHDEPAGFAEPLSCPRDATPIRRERPGHRRRPMALTPQPSRALALGLALVRPLAPLAAHARVGETRAPPSRVSTVPSDIRDPARAVQLGGDRSATRAVVQKCITSQCIAELLYQRANDPAPAWRRVTPLGMVHANGA